MPFLCSNYILPLAGSKKQNTNEADWWTQYSCPLPTLQTDFSHVHMHDSLNTSTVSGGRGNCECETCQLYVLKRLQCRHKHEGPMKWPTSAMPWTEPIQELWFINSRTNRCLHLQLHPVCFQCVCTRRVWTNSRCLHFACVQAHSVH